ncbi:unnamed protein product [Rhizophagus irregularis]|uniref:Uncharacterized protein n=1 Tax=Rhizophagus irregularis TaxID=588596 RepID=A0A916EKX1_9GLOM|nr:unnamed protein product [Rhizophagus irregularis]
MLIIFRFSSIILRMIYMHHYRITKKNDNYVYPKKRICRQEQKEREFNTACKIYNATSTSAVNKALEYHCMNHTHINELNNDEHEERSSSRRFSFRKRSRINYAESLYSLEEETEPTYKMQQKKFSNTSNTNIFQLF